MSIDGSIDSSGFAVRHSDAYVRKGGRSNMRHVTGLVCGMFLTTACAQAAQPNPNRTQDSVASVLAPLGFGVRKQPPPHFSAALQAQLQAAAHRLSDLQADQIGDNAGNGLDDTDPDDSGWDWTLSAATPSHSSSASADNIYGVTALGSWAAVRAGSDAPRFRTTLLDTGLGTQNNPAIDSPPDIVYLTLLGDSTDNPGFSELARARYDALRAAGGGAQALAVTDRDARHAAGHDGLIPYDLAWRMLGAAALDAAFPGVGYDADATVYASAAVDDLTSPSAFFDVNDSHENFYTHGLAWSLVVLARSGSAPAFLDSVRQQLLAAQHSDGAWSWSGATTTDDVQATAYALQALALSSSHDFQARHAARRGAHWLSDNQAANGGWQSAPDVEYPEVDAEAALGLYLVQLATASQELEPSADSALAITATSAALSFGEPSPGGLPPLASPAAR
jgi:hypothetical protein